VHLSPASLVKLFGEAHRTLQKGGSILLATPAAWSDGLLQMLARLNLVSEEEIKEHVICIHITSDRLVFWKSWF
jgi:hypothetical protein